MDRRHIIGFDNPCYVEVYVVLIMMHVLFLHVILLSLVLTLEFCGLNVVPSG